MNCKRDIHEEGVAHLKHVILEHVNMAWIIYTLTCEHCIMCQFDDYFYLCSYIVPCINVDIFCIFYSYEFCKFWVAMCWATTVTFYAVAIKCI